MIAWERGKLRKSGIRTGLHSQLLEMGALVMGLVFLLVGLISIVGLIGFSTSVPSTLLGINSARGFGKFR